VLAQARNHRRIKSCAVSLIAASMVIMFMLADGPASASVHARRSAAPATTSQAARNLAKQVAGLEATARATPASIPPASCTWQVAASAYLRLSGSSHDYGITDLNYCPQTRYVYASGQSYAKACDSSTDVDCVLVGLYTSGELVALCQPGNGQLGCNTASNNDAGVKSFAYANMCLNASCSELAAGETASY
jgi:hypothetical protein